MRFNLKIRWFWLDFGWFFGNSFKIGINFFEVIKYGDKIDILTFFDLQIFKFVISFGWSR